MVSGLFGPGLKKDLEMLEEERSGTQRYFAPRWHHTSRVDTAHTSRGPPPPPWWRQGRTWCRAFSGFGCSGYLDGIGRYLRYALPRSIYRCGWGEGPSGGGVLVVVTGEDWILGCVQRTTAMACAVLRANDNGDGDALNA